MNQIADRTQHLEEHKMCCCAPPTPRLVTCVVADREFRVLCEMEQELKTANSGASIAINILYD
jgi:hypothetical protein